MRKEIESLKTRIHQLSLKNKGKLPENLSDSDSSDLDSKTEDFLNMSFDEYFPTQGTKEQYFDNLYNRTKLPSLSKEEEEEMNNKFLEKVRPNLKEGSVK